MTSEFQECPMRPTAGPVPVLAEDERQSFRERAHRHGRGYERVRGGSLDVWCVTDHEPAKRLLTDRRLIHSGTPWAPEDWFTNASVWGPTLNGSHLLRQDGPAHHRLRAVVAPAFGPSATARARPWIEAATERVLDEIDRAEEKEQRTVDLVESFALPLVSEVVGRALGLDAPRGRRLGRLHLSNIKSLAAGDLKSCRRSATAAFVLLVDAYTTSARQESASGVMASMLRPPPGVAALSPTEAVENLNAVFRGGLASTVTALAYGAARLADHDTSPADVKALRALTQAPDATGLLTDALLRHHPPHAFLHPRQATEPIEIPGGVIPKGAVVTVSPVATDWHPGQSPALPALLRQQRPPGHRPHLTFGWGPHYCVGAGLVRVLLPVALSALFRRHPYLTPAVPLPRIAWQGTVLDRMPAAVPVALGDRADR